MKLLKKINGKHTGLFAAGLLLGTAGVKVLSSKDAKNVYTKCTAAVLRAKESVMKTVTTVQENAGDIHAEAQQINEDRKADRRIRYLSKNTCRFVQVFFVYLRGDRYEI